VVTGSLSIRIPTRGQSPELDLTITCEIIYKPHDPIDMADGFPYLLGNVPAVTARTNRRRLISAIEAKTIAD
jgi:hypothetical protein